MQSKEGMMNKVSVIRSLVLRACLTLVEKSTACRCEEEQQGCGNIADEVEERSEL